MLSTAIWQQARILIVDDQPIGIRLMEATLAQVPGLTTMSTTDARRALRLFEAFQPDLIVLDLQMPGIDGFGVMRQIRPLVPVEARLPILVITAEDSAETRMRALELGANDFMLKPYNPDEVMLRIQKLLDAHFFYQQLQHENMWLAQQVGERTRALEDSRIEVLERLARAAEYRDDDTGQHTLRVGDCAGLLAQQLGLADHEVSIIRRAATLHDVGKIGIPDSILLKPGKLSADEFDAMKQHTVMGAKILSGGHGELIRSAQTIALSHHERWDGSGYPNGIAGDAIPLAGRIVAVADVYDALTHDRPYKYAWTPEEAIQEIARQVGRHFDPAVVKAFMQLQLAAVQA